MRQLELAPTFSASLGGRVLPNARAAGDLDADGRTELVLGSVAGVLLVCKLAPDALVPWRSCALDGAVTAVCVDDREPAAPRVVVATSEGKCFVFQSLESDEPFAPAAEFKVALNASAVAVVGQELVVGTRDGRILVFGSDASGTGEYAQVAHFEIAAEIDAMRAFAGPFAASDGAPVLLMWCTSGEIFCYSLDQDAAVRDEDGARSVTLWNGHADDKQDLACMVDGVSVDGVPGHVAHVATGETVVLLSPSLDKLWDVQLPEAIVSLDRIRISSRPSTGHTDRGDDVLVACTWSGELHVIKNSERRVHFRVMFPAATMFTVEMTSDDACIDPIVVVVDTSGAIFVFADIDDTISRALDPTPLAEAIEKSAAFGRMDSKGKRERLLALLGVSPSVQASASVQDVIRAAMATPAPAPV